jgi:hypothetical protein
LSLGCVSQDDHLRLCERLAISSRSVKVFQHILHSAALGLCINKNEQADEGKSGTDVMEGWHRDLLAPTCRAPIWQLIVDQHRGRMVGHTLSATRTGCCSRLPVSWRWCWWCWRRDLPMMSCNKGPGTSSDIPNAFPRTGKRTNSSTLSANSLVLIHASNRQSTSPHPYCQLFYCYY